MSVRTSVSAVPGRNGRLVKRARHIPNTPKLYVQMLGDWSLYSFWRGVLISSPKSEYIYMTFRSLCTARDYIKKERRNGR